LTATRGSRSRWARKSSRRSTNSSDGSPHHRVRGAALAVEHRDLAEQVARAHEIQGQATAVGSTGLDPDLAAAHPVQGIAGIAFLKQHFAQRELPGVAKAGDPLQLVGAEVREHRIHLEHNREFALLAHGIAFRDVKTGVSKSGCRQVCHKSHIFAVASDYFGVL
jgi:hypothetical protein